MDGALSAALQVLHDWMALVGPLLTIVLSFLTIRQLEVKGNILKKW